jgi:hypothetical protein
MSSLCTQTGLRPWAFLWRVYWKRERENWTEWITRCILGVPGVTARNTVKVHPNKQTTYNTITVYTMLCFFVFFSHIFLFFFLSTRLACRPSAYTTNFPHSLCTCVSLWSEGKVRFLRSLCSGSSGSCGDTHPSPSVFVIILRPPVIGDFDWWR